MTRVPIGLRHFLKKFAYLAVLLPALVVLPIISVFWFAVPFQDLSSSYFIDHELRTIRATLFLWPVFAMFFYGVIRGSLFHPVSDIEYREWLATTPWHAGLPLPKGPVNLTWIDYTIVSFACGMTYWSALYVEYTIPLVLCTLAPAIALATALALAWGGINMQTFQTEWTYATVSIPIVVGLLQLPLEVFAICPFIMAGIAWLGMQQSQHALIREDYDYSETQTLQIGRKYESIRFAAIKRSLGWPHFTLFVAPPEVVLPRRIALVQSWLLGGGAWLLVDLPTRIADFERINVIPYLVSGACVLMGLVRLVAYLPVICSKLCLGRRVALNQLIIPEHDKIFLAPLLIAFLGILLPQLLHSGLHASIQVACGISVAVCYFLTRTMGPTVRKLWLTGTHSSFGSARWMNDPHFRSTAGQKA